MPRDFNADLERLRSLIEKAVGDIKCSIVIEVPTDKFEPFVDSDECEVEELDEIAKKLEAAGVLSEVEWFVRAYVYEMPDEIQLTPKVRLTVW